MMIIFAGTLAGKEHYSGESSTAANDLSLRKPCSRVPQQANMHRVLINHTWLLYIERFLISVVDRIEYGWRVAVDLVV
jgi:hypothetical protein